MHENVPYTPLTKLPTTKRLLIDASSIIKACCYAGKDEEFGIMITLPNGKPRYVNSAYYGSELFLKSYAGVLEAHNLTPNQTVLVLDGHDANRFRKNIYSGYKANREELAPELYDSFNRAIKRSATQLMKLGALVVDQDMTEADEIIAYLCKELDGEKLVWSRDGDMLLLQDNDTDILLNDELNPSLSIACDNKFATVYKALVGDPSDNLPGAKGFGEAAFNKMVLKYGDEGLETMQQMIEDRELDLLNDDEFKPFKKVIEGAGLVYLSYNCAKFYPENVNTAFNAMNIQARLIEPADDDTHPYLTRYSGQVSLAQTDADLHDLKVHLKTSSFVTIDLETSTPPESDEWVAAILATKKTKSTVVDVFGSDITGMGVTCGANANITQYIPIDHLDCHNFDLEDIANVLDAIPEGVPVAIHNTNFELPVLYENLGGWLSNAVDTQLMKSYVDENTLLGLKKCSKQYFDYDQTSYEEVTQGRKMNELTGAEVLDYGADDTIVGSALYNRLKFTLELESTIGVFENCELITQYWVAEAFIDGFEPDLERLKELELHDQQEFAELEIQLNEYLTSIDWKGCTFEPVPDLSPASAKEAFLALSGTKLNCRARLPAKVSAAVRDQGQPELADLFDNEDLASINATLEAVFEGHPEFDVEKDANLKHLVYDVWGLPIRFRTIPTKIMRKKGIKEGNPQIDVPAIDHAIQLDLVGEDEASSLKRKILKMIRKMKAANTRQGLYYTPYPVLAHWKDGKIHPDLGQSRTTTRRFAPRSPNVNQLPKKGDGLAVREMIEAPEGWVVFASDFSGQELRLSADASQDENMLACFIGDNLKDMHSLTGAAIAQTNQSEFGDYDWFMENIKHPEVVDLRALGKNTNFSTQFLCRAKKLAKLLVTDEISAQKYLNAKNETYSGLAQWQQDAIVRAKTNGYALTKLGAKRHLAAGIRDHNKYEAAKAERQAVNYEIQGSAAEMTKLAVRQMAVKGLLNRDDVQFILPVHDEVVLFLRIDTILETLPALHACMVIQYADMMVPLVSDISLGKTFGTLIDVGSNPDPEKIAAALKEIGGK